MQVSRDKWFLFGGILMILLGLVMLISPARFIEVFWILIGIAVILEGFITLFSVLPEIESPEVRKTLKIRGILAVAVGLVSVFLPLFVAGAAWAIMLYILGIEMLISAGLEFLVIRDMKAMDLPVREYVIEAILLIALALVLFLFPFQIGTLFVRLVGVLIILGGGVGLYRWKTYGA